MEIIGTNQEEKNRKTKKIMIWITAAIITLLVVSIILYVTIYYLKDQQFKFYVDGQSTSSSSDLFVYEGNTVYVSIKDIAPIVGYNYYNGGYKQYTEDNTKCYLESENEVCTLEKDSTTIYKTPPEKLDYVYYTIENPVKRINNKLYISSEGLAIACNLKFYYEPEQNQITIYTLPYYAKYYTKNYPTSAVSKGFENQKALLYGLMVVQNVENTKQNNSDIRYGVYDISKGNIEEVVGTKYTAIEFIEGTQEFIVQTTEGKVGIITSDGETKVQPKYDSLKQIDKDLNLYMATNDNKKGVIEKNGKILIYLEYDEIGVDTTKFQGNDIKNSYVLFNNMIPVKQNGKWGMYDVKGNLILPIEYDGIGCVARDKTLNNILAIPDIKAIVVSKTYATGEKTKTTLYGIVNSKGKELVPAALETVYSITSNGREEYTMIYNGTSYNVIEYVNKYFDLQALNEENESNEVQTNMEIVNETL